MSNVAELESISSVCTTSLELIQSEDFLRGIRIISKQSKTYNADYICSLFETLAKEEELSDEEKQALTSFVQDEQVAELGQKLLTRLSNTSVNIEGAIKDTDTMVSFGTFLTEIFAKDSYKKVSEHIWEVSGITELTLNRYEGFQKLQIEVNGETKEIYLENETLKVDSSNWKEIAMGGVRVKINPEGDITEYLEGAEKGEQLFTHQAAMREAEAQGKRLPYNDNENPEFQAIIKKVGVEEFMKLFPGYRLTDGSEFGGRGANAFWWSASHAGVNAGNVYFRKGVSQARPGWSCKACGLSARCIKD